jgi:hypothetical protein
VHIWGTRGGRTNAVLSAYDSFEWKTLRTLGKEIWRNCQADIPISPMEVNNFID